MTYFNRTKKRQLGKAKPRGLVQNSCATEHFQQSLQPLPATNSGR